MARRKTGKTGEGSEPPQEGVEEAVILPGDDTRDEADGSPDQASADTTPSDTTPDETAADVPAVASETAPDVAPDARDESIAGTDAVPDTGSDHSDPDATVLPPDDESQQTDETLAFNSHVDEFDAERATTDTDDMSADTRAEETPSRADQPPAVTPPVTVVEKSGPGFVPLLLGGLLAGGIGWAAATYLPTDAATDPADDGGAARIAALEEEVARVQQSFDGLAGPAEPVDLGGIETAQDELSTRLDELAARVEKLETPAEAEVETAEPAFDPAPLQSDIDAVRSEVAELTATSGALGSRVDELASDLGGRVDALAGELGGRIDAVEARAEDLVATAQDAEAEATAAARREALAEIADALQSGTPYPEAAAQLGDLPAPLAENAEGGVPSQAELVAALSPLSREALREARAVGAAEPGLGGFARSLLGARSLAPREGDDPDAVLSRVGAAARDGDFATALQEIEALPPEAGAVLDEWVARARIRLEAQAALQNAREG